MAYKFNVNENRRSPIIHSPNTPLQMYQKEKNNFLQIITITYKFKYAMNKLKVLKSSLSKDEKLKLNEINYALCTLINILLIVNQYKLRLK